MRNWVSGWKIDTIARYLEITSRLTCGRILLYWPRKLKTSTGIETINDVNIITRSKR
jgi:hypothetical protein